MTQIRDFSKKTINALNARGVRVVGTQYLPANGSPMPMANGETGYLVDDNGCGRVLTFSQVLKMAEVAR